MWTSQMRSHWDGMRYFKYEMTTWSHWFLTWILNDFSTKISLDISSISQFYLRIFSTTNIKIIWESQLRSQLNSQWYLCLLSRTAFKVSRFSTEIFFLNNIDIMFDLDLICCFQVPFTNNTLYYYVVSK